jgi:hypothetical protein
MKTKKQKWNKKLVLKEMRERGLEIIDCQFKAKRPTTTYISRLTK